LNGRVPIAYWVGGAYSSKKNVHNGIKSENIWNYYFEPLSEYSAREILPKTAINRYGQLKFKTDTPWDSKKPDVKIRFKFHDQGFPHEPEHCWDTELIPPKICLNNPNDEGRRYIRNLIDRYIKVKPDIMKKVDTFYNEHMSGTPVLGIHIRGCNDLAPVQGVKPIKRYIKYSRRYLKEHPESKIFVATDCQESLQKILREFGEKVCFRNVTRSKDKNPVQYGCRPKRRNKAGGPKVGEEVLIDALLLSRCDFLMRGFSNVASCASFFNPSMGLKYICKYDDKLKKYLEIT